MAELIHEHGTHVKTDDGQLFVARTYAEQMPDGIWAGWLEFVSAQKGTVLRTERETTQPTRQAVAYWASGLEPVYFEGAFARAQVVGSQ
jgi:hypothetical protein